MPINIDTHAYADGGVRYCEECVPSLELPVVEVLEVSHCAGCGISLGHNGELTLERQRNGELGCNGCGALHEDQDYRVCRFCSGEPCPMHARVCRGCNATMCNEHSRRCACPTLGGFLCLNCRAIHTCNQPATRGAPPGRPRRPGLPFVFECDSDIENLVAVKHKRPDTPKKIRARRPQPGEFPALLEED